MPSVKDSEPWLKGLPVGSGSEPPPAVLYRAWEEMVVQGVRWGVCAVATFVASGLLTGEDLATEALWGVGVVVLIAAISLATERRERIPHGDMPAAPPEAERRALTVRREALELGFVVAVTAGLTGVLLLADRLFGDPGATVALGVLGGVALANLISAVLVVLWERRHGRQLLRGWSTGQSATLLYVAPAGVTRAG